MNTLALLKSYNNFLLRDDGVTIKLPLFDMLLKYRTKNTKKEFEIHDKCFYDFRAMNSLINHIIKTEFDNGKWFNTLAKFFDDSQIYMYQTLLSWTISKDVYVFDDTFIDDLVKTPIPSNLPVDIIANIPSYSFYVKYNIMNDAAVDGFFVTMNYNHEKSCLSLCVILNYIDNNFVVLNFPLEDNNFINNFINGVNESTIEQMGIIINMNPILTKIFNILLYICSNKPDIIESKESIKNKTYLRNRLDRNMPLLIPKKLNIIKVGENIKKARIFNESSESDIIKHHTKSAHLRRGHWHGYWKGSEKTDNRRFEYNWISPIMINC